MNLSGFVSIFLWNAQETVWITNFRAYCLPALIRGSSAHAPSPTLLLRPLPFAGDTTWHFLLLPQDASCRADFIFLFLGLLPCVGKVQPPEVSKKESVKDNPHPFAYLKVFWSYSHITDSSVRFTILGWERIFHTVWKATDQSLLAPKRSRRTVQHNSHFQPFVCGCFPSWSLSVSSLYPCALKFHMTWSGWVLSRSLVCTWRR